MHSACTPAEWESVRRVLAAHLPAPDWLSPHDEGDQGMRRLLDEQLVAAHRRVAEAAGEMLAGRWNRLARC